MKYQVNGNMELLEKVTPKFPFMGKRMLQDNGSWLRALQQPNVELISRGRHAHRCHAASSPASGHYEVDVIVYATGFHATKFLWPMRGRRPGRQAPRRSVGR